jgi:hypothetical protein
MKERMNEAIQNKTFKKKKHKSTKTLIIRD